MNNRKSILLIIILTLLLAGNTFLTMQYIVVRQELQDARASLDIQRINERIFLFTQLFIEKVLKAEGEIDFDTRLLLENSVRSIGDEDILRQWTKFTESTNEQDAQKEVRNLLSLLLQKVRR